MVGHKDIQMDDPIDRARVQSFPITGSGTAFWLEEGGVPYWLELNVPAIKPDGFPNKMIGENGLTVEFHLHGVASCTGPNSHIRTALSIRKFTEMKLDGFLNQFLMVDSTASGGGGGSAVESFAGLWNWTDVISEADFGSSHPFTGGGWEGNYDSGVVTGDPAFDALVTNDDPFCTNPPFSTCVAVKPPGSCASGAHTLENNRPRSVPSPTVRCSLVSSTVWLARACSR